jgi:methionyl aminopeptidase
MRINTKEPFSTSGFFTLKDNEWLEKQRIAGRIVAHCLTHLQRLVEQKTNLTTRQLSLEAEQIILDSGCTATFKGYKGFPEAVCISVNKELVHGIPKDYVLQEGDVVSFDLGATYEGAIADSAITCIYGKPKNIRHVALIKATENALLKGIQAISVGKRLGVIGNAIAKSAAHDGFGIVTQYGGHGLEYNKPHASPFVENKSDPNTGIRIAAGLSIAIEPMLTIYLPETKVASDNWTVLTPDIGAHTEHSIFVHMDRVEIITWKQNDPYPKEIPFKI